MALVSESVKTEALEVTSLQHFIFLSVKAEEVMMMVLVVEVTGMKM